MDTPSVAAGDPIAYAAKQKANEELRHLEERLAHELMDALERCELEDQVLRLRRRLEQRS